MPNPTCIHLSATAISAFKACPQRFRLGYREGLRVDRDTYSQRMGTNWHALHEVYAAALTEGAELHHDEWVIEKVREYALNAVIALLNQRYENMPAWVKSADWALERQTLLTSFFGYLWYWQNDPVEVLASEVAFHLPLHEPRTGMPLSTESVVRVGKIDHLIRWHGAVCNLERKSTSRSIDSDSDYWETSKKDTQVSQYALAFQDMVNANVEELRGLDLTAASRMGNTLYDVFHRPTITPCWLTQAETTAFIKTGVYQETTFNVHQPTAVDVFVEGVKVERENGKKGFSIKESVEMFGARLLQDIYARPEHYFARREIARTDAEIREFRGELFAIYQAMQAFAKGDFWFSNEKQCRATFPCQYIPICYGSGARAVCDGTTTPAGFKRIFTDLTINGKQVV